MSIETSYLRSVNWPSLNETRKPEEKKPVDLSQEMPQNPAAAESYDVFLKEERLQEACRAAEAIDSEYRRMIAFVDICRELANRRHFDRALLFARTHLHGHFLSKALSSICRVKVKIGQINEALEIAGAASNQLSKEPILSTISKTLAEMGEAEKSTEVAYMISDELSRSLTFECTSKKLVEIGRIDEALEVANRMSNDYGKRRALAPIQQALENSGNKAKAEELLVLIRSLPYACID
ncbi:MAG TPA: hypothetical protein DCE71_05235 [Parachlamydiales bacterium]|nr:hypothetical protein [Parachlamydiales bacterium]